VTASAKRTGWRTWRTQYDGSITSSVTGWPVNVDTIGIRGRAYDTDPATEANSASIGSISDEWNACDTRNRRVRTPRAENSSSMAETAASGPETTVTFGPFTAAMSTPAST